MPKRGEHIHKRKDGRWEARYKCGISVDAKTSISRRFLAALLSFVLVLGLLPTSTLTAFAATAEHPDAITVSVTDQDGKALAGVTVAYSVSSTANGDDYASGTVTTDANGCVEVLTKDKYVADDLTLSATAALTDYVYADGSGRIEGAAITSDTQDFVIQLRSTKIPGVTVAANSGLVYAGYSFLTASGEAGVEDGTAFAKGKAAVLNANGYAQFTDYLRAQANVNVLYAEGEAKAGWSEDYIGFKVEAEVGVIQADGSVIIGSDDINAFVKGEVKVLCADGKAAFEFEDDGEFAIGVDASATLASASVKGGTTILGYKNKDTATGETETLLGFKVGAKATAGGSFAVWAESETAFEMEYMNINATTVKIDAAALLGLDLSITVPTPYFKWPW